MMYSIADYDPFADGVNFDDQAFQAAIDACAAAGGGTVFVPASTYALCGVVLKSHVHLQFEEGTVLLGSPAFEDYPEDEPIGDNIYQDVSHTCYRKSLFFAEDAEDISMTGHAVIDMRNSWFSADVEDRRQNTWRGPKTIAFRRCRNILLSDLQIRRATDICVMLGGCEDVTIRKLDLYVYIDGISPDACRNVLITDCRVISGDDGIVLKSSNVLGRRCSCENIFIRDCYVSSRAAALKIGTETDGDIRNVSFSNCRVENTRFSGIEVESMDGAVIENVEFRNIEMKRVATPIFVKLGNRHRSPVPRDGEIRDIRIENLTATGPYDTYPMIEGNYWHFRDKDRTVKTNAITSTLVGLKEHPLKNILLKDITIEVPGGYQGEPVPKEFDLRTNAYPENFVYGNLLPAYGMIFRHAEEVRMENVRILPLSPDIRPVILDDGDYENL